MKNQSIFTLRAMRDSSGAVILCRPTTGEIVGIIPAHHSNKPDRRNKYIMHNCTRYHLIWHGRPLQMSLFN